MRIISPEVNWLGFTKWFPLTKEVETICCRCKLRHTFQFRNNKRKLEWKVKRTGGQKSSKIPLSTALWKRVYESLKKDKVNFPKRFDGLGACYGGLVAIREVLEEYNLNDL